MKIKTLISAILISAALISSAQTPTTQSAHQKAHQQQLANAKSRLDRSVISNFIKEDVTRREAEVEKAKVLSAESQSMINDLLDEARTHIGKPYRGGSKGPKAFDCSGFSSYVYRQFGYTISPSSRQQFTEGEIVEKGDLRQGDLVFFTSRGSGKNVGHVGIVVSADNEKGTFNFIHASIKGVKISEFEGYYVPRYLGARRIITE